MKVTRFKAAGLQCVEVAPDNASADLPLVICMHGLGDSGESYTDIPRFVNTTDYRYIFPTAPLPYAGVGWSWFSFDNLNIAPGAARARGQVTDLLNELRAKYQTPANRTILGGFSQGGMMTFEVGLRYPEKLAGLFGLSTMLISNAAFDIMQPPTPEVYYADDKGDLQSALQNTAKLQTPVFIAHGVYDPVVPYPLGRATYELLQKNGISAEFYEFRGQHEISLEVLAQLKGFLARSL